MAINEAKFISDYYNFTVEVIKRSVEDTPALQMFRGVISPHDKKFPMELADICAKQLFDNKIRVPQLSNDKGHIQNPTYEQVRDYYFCGLLMYPLWGSVQRYGQLKAKINIRRAVKGYLDQWTNKRNDTEEHILLFQFKSDFKQIKLDEHIEIVELSDGKNKLIRASYEALNPLLSISELADCDYSIKNKNINDTFKKRVKCFEVALRLVDDGDVWSPGMLKIDCWSGALISGSITYIDLMERKAQKEQQLKTYHLKKENLAVLRRLHKALTQDNFKVYNMLELPLNRFQRALVKIHEDDFIIDTTISLESSLLFNIRGELRYKFSLRGQRLLKKQSGVYEKLRDLYDIRSEIVHNGLHLHHKDIQKIINKHGGTHRSFLQDIKEIVREILKVIIFSVADLGDMNSFSEHLDNEILERIKKGVSR